MSVTQTVDGLRLVLDEFRRVELESGVALLVDEEDVDEEDVDGFHLVTPQGEALPPTRSTINGKDQSRNCSSLCMLA